MHFLPCLAALGWAAGLLAQEPGVVTGRVIDAQDGQPMARVRLLLAGTARQIQTDSDGRFTLAGIAPGDYVLEATAVDYRLLRLTVSLAPGETKSIDMAMSPETFRRKEAVDVAAPLFAVEAPESGGALELSTRDLRNLSTVLTADPLRAVQGLPGVTANDFNSQFALRGAGFARLGFYLDDILLHVPFHAVQSEPDSGSLTLINGDLLESVALHAGAPPARFADRTAGIVEMRTREGDRRRVSIRGTVSASVASGSAEGPIGRAGRGSWLASVRKSYLQYLIERASDDATLAFGFTDGQARAGYDVTAAHHVAVSAAVGRSGLDRSGLATTAGLNAVLTSDYDFTLAGVMWRYSPAGGRFLATNRVAFLQEKAVSRNRLAAPLAYSGYGEWIWNGQASRVWNLSTLEFGASLRRLRDDGFGEPALPTALSLLRRDRFRGTGQRSGAWVRQGWSVLSGRLQVSASGRWDRHDANGASVLSPVASLAWQPSGAWRLQLAWGMYVQFPELRQFYSVWGKPQLLAERATHTQASLERRFGERMRLRVEAYNRADRDLLARPYLEPRWAGGRVVPPRATDVWVNSQRGYARGALLLFERRVSSSLSGWVSYACNVSRVRDGVLALSFPADFDQRHTVNVFASYRLRPTWNVSGRWSFGSGVPVAGFYRREGSAFFLSESRNQVRLPDYGRLDLRVNKAFVRGRWQWTVFAEVLNALNRDNLRFQDLAGFDSRTGQARLRLERTFPILPTGGLAVQF